MYSPPRASGLSGIRGGVATGNCLSFFAVSNYPWEGVCSTSMFSSTTYVGLQTYVSAYSISCE